MDNRSSNSLAITLHVNGISMTRVVRAMEITAVEVSYKRHWRRCLYKGVLTTR